MPNTIESMRRTSEADIMEIKPIKTRKDYDAALKAIEGLMSAKRNSPEGDRLDVLVTLVEAYEARHFALDHPDPVAAIKLVMEQRNLSVKDLVPFIGQANRVYEVLNHKRPLTMAMAWKLHRGLGIPAESLIRQAA
jgi:HTH-type transcriptional regulator/antitoxin HigA